MVHALRSWLPRTAAALVCAPLAFAAVLAAPADTRVIDAVRQGDAAGVRALIQRKAPVTVAEAAAPPRCTSPSPTINRDRRRCSRPVQANAATRYGITAPALAATNGPAVVARCSKRAPTPTPPIPRRDGADGRGAQRHRPWSSAWSRLAR
jgi:hypothetical protein